MNMIEKWSGEYLDRCSYKPGADPNVTAPAKLEIPHEEWVILREEVAQAMRAHGNPFLWCADIGQQNFLFMGIPAVPV